MRKYLSFLKLLTIGILFIPIYPVIWILPKYQAYIFVVTTGRSGSGSLANTMKSSPKIFSVHEPYPILNNSFGLTGRWHKAWIYYQFYFVKVPLIAFSKLSRKNFYLETNHLFAKTFASHAKKVFGDRLKLIYLERPVEAVSKSIYEIGKIPGTLSGNKWYLDPYAEDNLVDFPPIYEQISDPEKDVWRSFYQCVWYWYEIKERSDQFESICPMLRMSTSELDDMELLSLNLCSVLDLEDLRLQNNSVDRNLKSNEKRSRISESDVARKVDNFRVALYEFKRQRISDVRFSVVIPLYNKEKYISEAIKSVLSQTYECFELIVVDDGSTDNGLERVRSLTDERVRVVKQCNRGVSVARNVGIERAANNWVCLLDADDAWRPNFLAQFAKSIARDESYIAYGCSYRIRKPSGREVAPSNKAVPLLGGKIPNYYKTCLLADPPFNSSGVCLNKQLLIRRGILGLFPSGVKRGEDLDAWVKLAARDSICFIPNQLHVVNVVPESATTKPYRYSESFPYEMWITYRVDSYMKKLFLILLVVKRKLHILKKMAVSRQGARCDKAL